MTPEALGDFLKENDLETKADKVMEAAAERVAEAHGFDDDEMEELDLDELDAVAGGMCFCLVVGGGTGHGKRCGCGVYGKGTNDSGKLCECIGRGFGHDA